ncbi:hypothetical protein B0H14DRAFT_2607559 [Mycena olivaceomarginata]|nr:hypothetical protein B0H14DRAFT_2607559 [Mycena olivaceomarginata]
MRALEQIIEQYKDGGCDRNDVIAALFGGIASICSLQNLSTDYSLLLSYIGRIDASCTRLRGPAAGSVREAVLKVAGSVAPFIQMIFSKPPTLRPKEVYHSDVVLNKWLLLALADSILAASESQLYEAKANTATFEFSLGRNFPILTASKSRLERGGGKANGEWQLPPSTLDLTDENNMFNFVLSQVGDQILQRPVAFRASQREKSRCKAK